MCEFCKYINNLSKTIPLISFENEKVAYLFKNSLYVEETESTRKYRIGIRCCPMCGRNLTEE